MTIQTSTLVLSNLSERRLASLARDMSRDLTRSGVKAVVAEEGPSAGARGDAFTVGQLAADLATSGAATALIECLKAYLSRESGLAVKVNKPDGSSVEINARNIKDPELRSAIAHSIPRSDVSA